MTVSVTKHAMERAAERFNVRLNAAEDWIKARFRGAKFISDIIADNGDGVRRLFVNDGVMFILAECSDKIITVAKPYKHSVADKVRKTVQRELDKARRQARKVERINSIKIAELELVVANRKLNQLKARSPKVKAIIQGQTDELMTQIDALHGEIIEAKREMTRTAQGVAAFL